MRGRDIERYGYKWAGLWLIYIPWHFPFQFDESIQGASEKAEQAFKEQYPAVYSHMLQYKEPLSKRNKAETGIRYEWYAMQRWGAKYWDDFSKPKIVYMEIMSGNQKAGFPAFTYDEKEHVVMNTGYIMSSESENLLYLLGVLNSKIGKLIIQQYVIQLGDAGYRILAQYTTKFPIVKQPPQEKAISMLTAQQLEEQTPEREAALNALVYEVYGLCEEEKQYLETL